MLKTHEEESSDEFELVSNNQVEDEEEPDGRSHEGEHRDSHFDEVDAHRGPSGIGCHRGYASQGSVERDGRTIRHFLALHPGPPIGSQATHLKAD